VNNKKKEEIENDVPNIVDDPIFKIPHYYINLVTVTHNFFEFQLIMGKGVDNPIVERPYRAVEPQCILQMSPQHLKVLFSIIDKQLTKYEEKFGKIPDAPEPQKTK